MLSAVVRVGKNGAFVDNAHSGGMFARIDVNNGEIGKAVFDQYGNNKSEWNGLDYNEERFVPHWPDIKEFVCDISKKILHHRLVAMDVTVTQENKPLLIEYNLHSFSYWLFMMTNQKPLGEYTDEIIEYCSLNRSKIYGKITF